jgi:hypothetical protein
VGGAGRRRDALVRSRREFPGLTNSNGYTIVRFGERAWVVYTPSETYFKHVNLIGSTTMYSNHTGAVAEDVPFAPYGGLWESGGSGGYKERSGKGCQGERVSEGERKGCQVPFSGLPEKGT